jgi:hypothetical protein
MSDSNQFGDGVLQSLANLFVHEHVALTIAIRSGCCSGRSATDLDSSPVTIFTDVILSKLTPLSSEVLRPCLAFLRPAVLQISRPPEA